MDSRYKGKKFILKFALKVVQKAIKLQYVNFQKIPGEHVPNPLAVIFVLPFASNQVWCCHFRKKIIFNLNPPGATFWIRPACLFLVAKDLRTSFGLLAAEIMLYFQSNATSTTSIA